jgi:multidrug efflux system membrane fusion protein
MKVTSLTASRPELSSSSRWLLGGGGLLAAILVGAYLLHPAYAAKPGGRGDKGPAPVTVASVTRQAMPVWLDALGTVVPRQYVNVMPRVAGLLQSVNFREGQPVKAGALLAVIDPAPYRIAMQQAAAQLARDQAQLAGAESDLARYVTLQQQDSIAVQQVDQQRALVAQYKGTVAADRAALANARLQLSWTRITAPTSGIAGLRTVDAGNMVGTSGAIGGGSSAATGTASSSTPIVTLAQVQPVAVTFTVAQTRLPDVLARLRTGAMLPVQAWDQRRSAKLADGKLIAVDNQINTATGTVNLKAEFANQGYSLFPNQFVNVRLLVDTVQQALVVPLTAVATGAPGSYVYVVDSASKVALRPIKTSVADATFIVVTSGLAAGERVVTDGLDKLRDGATVKIVTPLKPGQAEPAHHRNGGHRPQGQGA